MSEAKDNFIVEKLYPADLNKMSENANDGGGFRDSINAGETINGGTLPVAIYIDTSDNEAYACDGNDLTKLEFVGFVISNSTDGNPIDLQCNGIVRGFSGLAEGEKYYVQDDKTIGTSKGTYEILVGIAISATELLIMKNNNDTFFILIVSDNLKISADTERLQAGETGYIKQKEIRIRKEGTIRVKFDLKSTAAAKVYGRIYINSVAVGTEKQHTGTTYATYSEDINIVNDDININGALIQLYIREDVNASNDAYFKNFRIYYDKTPREQDTVVQD